MGIHVLEGLVVEAIVLAGHASAWERLRRIVTDAGFGDIRRFDAVDGHKLGLERARALMTPRALCELQRQRRGWMPWSHEAISSLGAVGCYLSHLELWKRAAERDVPTLILEQDAELAAAPAKFNCALTRIPKEADVALMGHFAPFPLSVRRRTPPEGFHRLQPSSRVFGSHAYVVTPNGARRLIERALPMNEQVDSYLRLLSDPYYGIHVVYHEPPLVRQHTQQTSSTTQPAGAMTSNLYLAACGLAGAFRLLVVTGRDRLLPSRWRSATGRVVYAPMTRPRRTLKALCYLGLRTAVRVKLNTFLGKLRGRDVLCRFCHRRAQFPTWMRAGRSTDWWTFDQVFIQDQYGPLADLDSPELVVDCGANAGYASVLLLNWFPGARVIAVEPDPANVEICRKNLAPYGDRAMLLAAAVWSRNARVMLSPGTLGYGKEWAREVRRPGPSEKGNIRAIDVPTLISLGGRKPIDLLKIDIEGSELELFSRGAGQWLPWVRNIVVELHNEECRRVFLKSLDEYDCELGEWGDLTICRNLRKRTPT